MNRTTWGLLTALAAMPWAAMAQQPSGSDINTAIPIVFKQVVSDVGDKGVAPLKVYKIALAKGQEISILATAKSLNPGWEIVLLAPSTQSFASRTGAQTLAGDARCCSGSTSLPLRHTVAASGTYYIAIIFGTGGLSFNLQVDAVGTPIAVPNPTTAGCLSGRVDSITYSLQFIAAGLPDEISIGGARACASCTVKPPLYPEISTRLEDALRSNGEVEACYDSTGNIFQLKLLRP